MNEDYKLGYLRERVRSLKIEAQGLMCRFAEVQRELPLVESELQAYTKELEDAQKKEKNKDK
jgi:hypothetical protein